MMQQSHHCATLILIAGGIARTAFIGNSYSYKLEQESTIYSNVVHTKLTFNANLKHLVSLTIEVKKKNTYIQVV